MQRFLVTCLTLAMLSCSEGIRTRDHGTRLNSKDYPDKEERLATFNKVLGTHSAIKDVEFDLFNVNGFGKDRSIPGASSWHYRYVVKVDPADVHSWTEFLPPLDLDTSIAWQDSLVSLCKEKWAHTSAPLYFSLRPGKQLVTAYKPEGIIFWEIINN